MIIKFNPSLFLDQLDEIHSKVARILLEIMEDRFLWDLENLTEIVYNDIEDFWSKPFTAKYLAPADMAKLKEKVMTSIELSAYITNEHHFYLSNLTIGTGVGEILPQEAYKIITLPSKLVVENANNDWKFIRGVADKYTGAKKRRLIYRLLNKAIINGWIEAENAGGIQGIEARVTALKDNRYKEIEKYKIAALFDSDRSSPSGFDPNQKKLIEFLKGEKLQNVALSDVSHEDTDIIIWHKLYKRELENYVPLPVLFKEVLSLTPAIKKDLQNKNSEELDFIKYEDYLASIKEIDVKEVFPNLFLTDFARAELEFACSHHHVKIDAPNDNLEVVSEIELILTKLVRLI